MIFLNILQLLQVILAIYVLMLVFKKGALNSHFHIALVCLVVSILVIPPFGRKFINGATMESKEEYSNLDEAYDRRDDRRHDRDDRHDDRRHDRDDRHDDRRHDRDDRRDDRRHDRDDRRDDRRHDRDDRRDDRRHDRDGRHDDRRHDRDDRHDDRRHDRDDRRDDRRDGRHHHHRHDHDHRRDGRHHHRHDHDPIFPTPNHKLTPSPYTPTPTPPAPTPYTPTPTPPTPTPYTPPAPKPTPTPTPPAPTPTPTPPAPKPASNVVPGNTLSPPESIQMWMNNSVVYIIGKGTPGATLELSLSKSPFQNIFPAGYSPTVNTSGDIEYSINGNGNNTENTLFNNIVTELNETIVYFRLSYKGKTSPIISWNDFNFGYCYFNNPAQNTATDISSFQSTLKAANEYCVNQLDWSSRMAKRLPTSWP